MKIINTTPHPIIIKNEFSSIEIKPSNIQLRLKTVYEPFKNLEYENFQIKVMKSKFEQVNVPPKVEGTFYIVSSIVAQAYPERDDFLMVGETIRNEKGQILGCKSLVINPYYNFEK